MKYWIIFFSLLVLPPIGYTIEKLPDKDELEIELESYQQEDFPVTDTFEEEFNEEPTEVISTPSTEDITTEEINDEQLVQGSYQQIASLRILNKITSKINILKAKVGQSIQFDKFRIMPILCWRSANNHTENKVLLEVYENKSQNEEEKIFYSWMLSNNLSISPFEHPIYDITILNCSESVDQ